MKILNADQLRKVDLYTIENEPVSSVDLMERAASACTDWLCEHFDRTHEFAVICGPGNNGGDGLAIARLLSENDRKVRVYANGEGSPDNQTNLKRLAKRSDAIFPVASFNVEDLQDEIVIDAMFGYGLNRKLEGIWSAIAENIARYANIVVAIDMPSGVYVDKATDGIAVHADYTLTFQVPKLAFFIPENDIYIGEWITLDIGLDADAVDRQSSPYALTTVEMIHEVLPRREKFDHKGTYGHALLVVGSYGKVGAAILSARAALRSGVGLLTVHVPRQAVSIMQVAVPEAMASIDKHDYIFSGWDGDLDFEAIGLGCGLGLHSCTTSGIKELLEKSTSPLVVDADGLNTISQNRELLKLLPHGSILTPHLKEFARLFGESEDHFERLGKLRRAAAEYQLVIVLKGAHTAIANHDGSVHFNSTGNPGMATAGSGDVLTGVITSLLAQGLQPIEAAMAGVYIHGSAGDLAAEQLGGESLIASDIIDGLPRAFTQINAL